MRRLRQRRDLPVAVWRAHGGRGLHAAAAQRERARARRCLALRDARARVEPDRAGRPGRAGALGPAAGGAAALLSPDTLDVEFGAPTASVQLQGAALDVLCSGLLCTADTKSTCKSNIDQPGRAGALERVRGALCSGGRGRRGGRVARGRAAVHALRQRATRARRLVPPGAHSSTCLNKCQRVQGASCMLDRGLLSAEASARDAMCGFAHA